LPAHVDQEIMFDGQDLRYDGAHLEQQALTEPDVIMSSKKMAGAIRTFLINFIDIEISYCDRHKYLRLAEPASLISHHRI